MRVLAAFALVLGAALPCPGQEPARLPVMLDVLVLDARGRSVDTLRASDFAVTEGGAAVPVDDARFVAAAPRPNRTGVAQADEPSAPPRVFGILLDEYHLTPGPGTESLRAAMIGFVRGQLAPGDRVTVLKPLDSLMRIEPAADRDAVVRAIESFEPRRGDYAPRSSFEKEFIGAAPAAVEAARARITTAALTALAADLGSATAGRKTLLFVSEALPAASVTRRTESRSTLGAAVLAANRARVAVYPVSPPVAEPRAPDAGTADALTSLASGTSGRVLPGNARLDEALASVLAEASGYYEITLSRAPSGDARLQPVHVAVRPTGLTVRARPGYWIAQPRSTDAEARRAAAAVRAAAFAVPRRSSALIRPWFGMSVGPDGGTRVSFAWEPAPRVPGNRDAPAAPARVVLSVAKPDGAPVFEGAVLPSNVLASRAPPLFQVRASFETNPGPLLVRMAIEDSTGTVVDRDVRDLVVGRFSGPVALGTAEFVRARNVREQRMLSADPDAPPTADREFSRIERVFVRIPVVVAGGGPVIATARLASGFGGTMRELAVTELAVRPGTYQVDVPVAGLAAGSYAIDVSARTADGEASERLPFRVTP